MMRSLWTAASGMKTQQYMVDTISNNLANVNTIGYKKERLEFKSLLYETIREAGDTQAGGVPVNLQYGHGVKTVGMVKSFSQGTFERTEAPLDLAIEGSGFFTVRDVDGSVVYTRDGSFKTSLYEDQLAITTVDGRLLLNIDGEPVTFPDTVVADALTINRDGRMTTVEDGNLVDLGVQIAIVQFRNPQGLKSLGSGFYGTTIATGEPLFEVDNDELKPSQVVQGALEGSNVQAVEEMVKLIVAQRAYEISSKAIQTSDEMLARANELKR